MVGRGCRRMGERLFGRISSHCETQTWVPFAGVSDCGVVGQGWGMGHDQVTRSERKRACWMKAHPQPKLQASFKLNAVHVALG